MTKPAALVEDEIIICCKSSEADLEGILRLHTANHIDNLSAEEASHEGFVTAKYVCRPPTYYIYTTTHNSHYVIRQL